MTSVHERPAPIRLLAALFRSTIGSLRQPREVARFAKAWLRFPLEHSAGSAVQATKAISFAELFPEYDVSDDLMSPGDLSRHDWNVRLDEKIYIGLLIKAMEARQIFEIGTFDGGTTKYMAEAAGASAKIYTLDLPPADFDRTQGPESFSGTQVGRMFRNSSVETRITQLLGDSTRFDYTPYQGKMDFVFVDAAHDYIHGYPDSKNALRLARPGGLVVWHDFDAYWPELVFAVREAARDCALYRLQGTTLALVRLP